jgi:hypothetical protein
MFDQHHQHHQQPQEKPHPHHLRQHHQHRRKKSSITSISTTVAGNVGKIERFQAFDQWRFIQADLYHDFIVTGFLVHRGEEAKTFILECTSPGRHWLSKKTLKQFKTFQENLEKVFPVEAGSTGRPRVLPKLPRFFPTRQRQIERFLSALLTVSPLIARSRLIGDFLMEDCIEEADEAEVLHGIHISAPIFTGDELKCRVVEYNLENKIHLH